MFAALFSYPLSVLLTIHSFPTRRSSDLQTRVDRDGGSSRRAIPRRLLPPVRAAPQTRRRHAAAGDHDPGPRSEEHTSELQSLRHLVCRLLLEKKKKQKLYIRIKHEQGTK